MTEDFADWYERVNGQIVRNICLDRTVKALYMNPLDWSRLVVGATSDRSKPLGTQEHLIHCGPHGFVEIYPDANNPKNWIHVLHLDNSVTSVKLGDPCD